MHDIASLHDWGAGMEAVTSAMTKVIRPQIELRALLPHVRRGSRIGFWLSGLRVSREGESSSNESIKRKHILRRSKF